MTATGLTVALEDIPSCFEGIIPSTICTVSDDGTPNITWLSVVTRVDENHVALSRQFFKKTEENTLVNPIAQVQVVEPQTGRQFLLDMVYERTDTSGPLFERMRTKLDAVAAHEGMDQVFKLRGVDICRVTACEMVPCEFPDGPARKDVAIERVEEVSQRIAEAEDLEDVFAIALNACVELLNYPHAFVMLTDESGERLYTVASAGFPSSGTGSEVRIGDGLIGLAAERRQTVRLANLGRDIHYSQAQRRPSSELSIEQVIPLPSIASMRSQLIAPMLAHRKLVGVICLQSHEPGAFQAADECVVGILASHVAMAMAALGNEPAPAAPAHHAPGTHSAEAMQVKYFCEDSTVFIDNEYLIKGVAGGILWKLLNAYVEEQRTEFSNKEIRLDSSLELPDIKDNLEARLILLRKRLEERATAVQIEKTARGRFRLVVERPVNLVSVEAAGPL
ncbi:MAG: GAF domain-containing protein [Dehalococcoidia bacterium]